MGKKKKKKKKKRGGGRRQRQDKAGREQNGDGRARSAAAGEIRCVEKEHAAAVPAAADVVAAVAVADAGLAAGHDGAAEGRHDVHRAPACAGDVLRRRQPAGVGAVHSAEPRGPARGAVHHAAELRLLAGDRRVHVLAADATARQHPGAHRGPEQHGGGNGGVC